MDQVTRRPRRLPLHTSRPQDLPMPPNRHISSTNSRNLLIRMPSHSHRPDMLPQQVNRTSNLHTTNPKDKSGQRQSTHTLSRVLHRTRMPNMPSMTQGTPTHSRQIQLLQHNNPIKFPRNQGIMDSTTGHLWYIAKASIVLPLLGTTQLRMDVVSIFVFSQADRQSLTKIPHQSTQIRHRSPLITDAAVVSSGSAVSFVCSFFMLPPLAL